MASLAGLHPDLMRPRVEALLADPEAIARGVHVVSGFRSVERQRQLWEAAVRKYGSERAASKWVARPGRSNHGPKVDGFGIAVDFGIRGVRSLRGQWPQEINDWFKALAAEHGLFQRMEWEDWHYEPIADWEPADEEDELTKDEKRMLAELHAVIVKGETSKTKGALIGGMNHGIGLLKKKLGIR